MLSTCTVCAGREMKPLGHNREQHNPEHLLREPVPHSRLRTAAPLARPQQATPTGGSSRLVPARLPQPRPAHPGSRSGLRPAPLLPEDLAAPTALHAASPGLLYLDDHGAVGTRAQLQLVMALCAHQGECEATPSVPPKETLPAPALPADDSHEGAEELTVTVGKASECHLSEAATYYTGLKLDCKAGCTTVSVRRKRKGAGAGRSTASSTVRVLSSSAARGSQPGILGVLRLARERIRPPATQQAEA